MVAERVVDRLEVVEVDEHYGELLAAPASASNALRQAVAQQQAVWQAGKRIAGRELLDARLGALPLRDVEGGAPEAGDAAIVGMDRHGADKLPDERARTRQRTMLDVAERLAAGQRAVEQVAHPIGFPWRHEIERTAAVKILGPVAEHRLHTARDERVARVAIDFPDIFACGLREV